MLPSVCDWWDSPQNRTLQENAVHIWRKRLDRGEQEYQPLFDTLSDDERQRAQRLVFERDRRRFVISRGTLRVILSLYLHVEPGVLVFQYNHYGKPSLVGYEHMGFNVSHAADLTLFAVASQPVIGIDAEYLGTALDYNPIIASCFSPTEMADFSVLPVALQRERFFRIWTLKEAYVKALGRGLSQALDQLEVSFDSQAEPALLDKSSDAEDTADLTLLQFVPASDYIASLVVKGQNPEFKWWTTPQHAGGKA